MGKYLKIKMLLITHIITTKKTIKDIKELEESLNKEINLKNLCDLYWELEIFKILNENTIEVKNNEECIQ